MAKKKKEEPAGSEMTTDDYTTFFALLCKIVKQEKSCADKTVEVTEEADKHGAEVEFGEFLAWFGGAPDDDSEEDE